LAEVRREAFGMFLQGFWARVRMEISLLDCHIIAVLILVLLPDRSALPGPIEGTTLAYTVSKVCFEKNDIFVPLYADIQNYFCYSTNREW
jgi:hypothetical protein